MPNALTFIVGADSKPFAQEMRRMEAIARASSASIGASMVHGGRAGFSGLLREAITIPREIIEGRGVGRILGSMSLLIQYMGNLIGPTRGATAALEARAEMLAKVAEREALLGQKAIETSRAVAAAKDIDLASTKAEVTALEESAAAHLANAESATVERIAIEKDIAIKQAESALAPKAGFMSMGIGGVTALVAGLAAVAVIAGVIYEHMRGVAQAIKEAGMETPKMSDPDYIPKLSRHTADAAKSQRELNEAVKDAVDAYNSANAAAERMMTTIKREYDFHKQSLELDKEIALAKATTPEAKAAVEKRFSDAQLRLQKKEHSDIIDEMQKQAVALDKQKQEALSKKKSVNTAEEDSDLQRQADINKAAGQAFLSKDPSKWEEFKNQAAIQLGSTTNADKARIAKAIQDAEAGGQTTAQLMIKNANNVKDKTQEHDQIRKDNEKAQKEADKAAADAAVIRLKRTAQAGIFGNEDAEAEVLAKKKLELLGLQNRPGGGQMHEELNSLQRIGGMRTVNSMATLEQTQRRSEHHLAHISQVLDRQQRDSHSRSFGRAQH
jgi:hypothetical protein